MSRFVVLDVQTHAMRDSTGYLPARRHGPTPVPLLAPWPQLVVVADTNTLASRACHAVRHGEGESLFTGLSTTGRSRVFVGAHVPRELDDHLRDVAASCDVSLALAEQVLWTQVLASASVVPLAIREFMDPGIRAILRADPELPPRLRGDPDDVETLAVARFLAPSVIVSADSVFTRLGFSNTTAATWVGIAYSVLRMAGIEASMADAAAMAELGLRLLVGAAGSVARAARAHPLIAIFTVVIFALVGLRYGAFGRERLREAMRWLRRVGEPLVTALSDKYVEHAQIRRALHVVEPYGVPTLEQAAARHLARCGRLLTPSELRDGLLRYAGVETTAKALKAAMTEHPAFVRWPNDLYGVGLPVEDRPGRDAPRRGLEVAR